MKKYERTKIIFMRKYLLKIKKFNFDLYLLTYIFYLIT